MSRSMRHVVREPDLAHATFAEQRAQGVARNRAVSVCPMSSARRRRPGCRGWSARCRRRSSRPWWHDVRPRRVACGAFAPLDAIVQFTCAERLCGTSRREGASLNARQALAVDRVRNVIVVVAIRKRDRSPRPTRSMPATRGSDDTGSAMGLEADGTAAQLSTSCCVDLRRRRHWHVHAVVQHGRR